MINPNPDAVAEFRVLQSNYAAEYGRSGGGIVSMVIKSGTNSVHGTAFDYLRNEDLDANTFFNNEQGIARQILKRNQYGGTVGGPVYVPHVVDGRNKLFFFFSYEGQRQNANAQAGKITTFTPLEAQGNFSQSVERRSGPGGGRFPGSQSVVSGQPYARRASHHRSDPHQPGRSELLQGRAATNSRQRVMCFRRRRRVPTIPNTSASSITTSARATR